MKKAIFEITEWMDDLMWMPSQCYMEIKIGNDTHVIYLRWRWEDPWQLSLILNTNLNSFVIDGSGEWIELDMRYLTQDTSIHEVHGEALKKVSEYFENVFA